MDVFVEYDGDDAIQVGGYAELLVFSHLDQANLEPDKLGRNEDAAWDEFVRSAANRPIADFTALPNGTYWVTISGPPLTNEQVRFLSNDPTAALLIMGVFRWADERKAHEVDFCVLSQHDPPVSLLCGNHNGPGGTRSGGW